MQSRLICTLCTVRRRLTAGGARGPTKASARCSLNGTTMVSYSRSNASSRNTFCRYVLSLHSCTISCGECMHQQILHCFGNWRPCKRQLSHVMTQLYSCTANSKCSWQGAAYSQVTATTFRLIGYCGNLWGCSWCVYSQQRGGAINGPQTPFVQVASIVNCTTQHRQPTPRNGLLQLLPGS